MSAVNAAGEAIGYLPDVRTTTAARSSSWPALVLPREHGSWSLALEPVALGLLATPSVAGTLLGLAAAAAFLTRRPAQAAAGRFGPAREAEARAPLAVLAGGAVLATAGAGWLGGWSALAPLLPAFVPATLFAYFDARGEARAAAAELAGCAAFAFVPVACATLAGQAPGPALALGALSLCRAAPSVLVVRTFLRRRKGRPTAIAPALASSCVGTGVTAWLAFAGFTSGAALAVALLLLARAVWLLGPRAPILRATRLGVLEAALGVVYVLAAGLGKTC
ncbi:MAG: YwiC-like family protein [Opitutaceae bacterium]